MNTGDVDMSIVPFDAAAARRAAGGKRKATSPPKKQPRTASAQPAAAELADGGADWCDQVAADMAELDRLRGVEATMREQTVAMQKATAAMRDLQASVQQLTSKVDQLTAEVTELKAELRAVKAQHHAQLRVLKDQHSQTIEHLEHVLQGAQAAEDIALTPQVHTIERNVVLAPKYPPDTTNRQPAQVTLGKLTQASAAAFLGVPESDIRTFTKVPPRNSQGSSGAWKAGDACNHIIVEFKSRTTKFELLKGATRRALEAQPCAALSEKGPRGAITSPYYLCIRDHLLTVELEHKQELQQSAMDLLQQAQRALPARDPSRVAYSWRRSKMTWRVPVGNQGCWALLSHLDVRPGSTLEEVQQAVHRAGERAKAEYLRRQTHQAHGPAPGGASTHAPA